jgi:hypothetical protein
MSTVLDVYTRVTQERRHRRTVLVPAVGEGGRR